MRKQLKAVLSLFIVLNTLPLMPVQGQGSENLSPIETVDWEISETETSSAKESSQASQESVKNEESVISEETVNEFSTEATLPAELPKVDQAQDLLKVLQNNEINKTAQYYLVNFNQGQVALNLAALMPMGEFAYLTLQEPPYIPSTLLVQLADEKVTTAYIPLDSLVTYVTDAINNYPEIYDESPVKEFYVYAQEHYADLEGRLLEVNAEDYGLNQNYQEIQEIQDFLMVVLAEFMDQQGAQLSYEKDQGADILTLEGDLSSAFTEIAVKHLMDYPELVEKLSFIEQGLVGTISFNYDKYQIGMGLLVNVAEDQTQALEFYLQPGQAEYTTPSSDTVYTEQAFNDMVGFEVLKGIREYEDQVGIEQFNLEGEANGN